MLRTVIKNSTIIITKYTWYHRYREIIQITGGPPLRLHRKLDSKAGRRNPKCSDVIWSLSRLTRIVVSAILNHLPLVRFLPAQNDMVVCHSWRKVNKIMPFSYEIIICSHLFICFCTSDQPDTLKWRQLSGASGICLASKWRRPQAIKSRLISTLNWNI